MCKLWIKFLECAVNYLFLSESVLWVCLNHKVLSSAFFFYLKGFSSEYDVIWEHSEWASIFMVHSGIFFRQQTYTGSTLEGFCLRFFERERPNLKNGRLTYLPPDY